LPTLPARQLSPEEEELQRKQAQLIACEAELSERELERATLQAELAALEKKYLEVVGRKYAELDKIEAKIAEVSARQNPKNQAAKERAEAARKQAEESAKSVGEREEQTKGKRAGQSESLRTLYRQAAKLLHPDLTLDPNEKAIRQRLMAEVNQAYAEGDEERIRRILREWQASPESVQGDGPGVELVRVIRKIAQVQSRLQTIATEMNQLRGNELFQLKTKIQESKVQGRDLLAEMARQLDGQIAEARERLNRIAMRTTP
jgi:hypothetical protein